MGRIKLLVFLLCLVAALSLVIGQGYAQSPPNNGVLPSAATRRRMTNAQHQAAADRAAARHLASGEAAPFPVLNPLGIPDYFNVPNYTNSPLLHKFVDTLPGLGAANANNLGSYIPIAIPDTNTYPGSDYYRIGLKDYTQQFHTDLPATTQLRGYIDLNPAADGKNHYLGPLIIAHKGTPTRIKFTNMLPTGTAGNLFLPVDTTIMGAGTGPLAMNGNLALYNQNRAELHLHGGDNPWISDGTPHQWITPAGDPTPYKKGESQQNVPDMPNPGDGSATYYYPNGQSSRLMFYHDHAYGMTRLNVYAGEAAGYLLTDDVEEDLISNQKVIPDLGGVYHYGIPLIIQDKTFVPDPVKLAATDPTWDTAHWGGKGNLWFPHVYTPNQNPADPQNVNPFGRWDYGPWYFPPVTNINHQPITLPSGVQIPGVPNPSIVTESYEDTPIINGTAYPKLTVDRRAYRFRILSAANERFFNLGLYYVDPLHPTEVKMVPAVAHPGDSTWPARWPTDDRVGGVPDPRTAGPDIIQIGTEGGLLPNPVVIPSTPIGYSLDSDHDVETVKTRGLNLAPAERADVIVDFSQVPAGSKLILYNDSGAPVPEYDTRIDYYTGNPDQTTTGGAPGTLEGFGPNTRTLMLINVSNAPAAPAFNLAALQAALPKAYAAAQPPHIVPQIGDGAAKNTYANLQDNTLTFTPLGKTSPVTVTMKQKAIQEMFELDYGRGNATLGTELPFTTFESQTTIPLAYIDPATDIIKDGEVQLWKITHDGVDSHPIHFHLFNVQVINRVSWDGTVQPPHPNELGWKDTVVMNPEEDCIVAMKPIKPVAPFEIPDSVRRMDVTMPLGSTIGFTQIDPLTNKPISVTNQLVNFGQEYVWHCHLLGHEEMDMMRPTIFQVKPGAPRMVTAAQTGPGQVTVTFAAPNNTGGSPITGYSLISLPATTTVCGVNGSPLVMNGLKVGVSYVFLVKATNAVGTGLSSDISNAVTISAGPVAPSDFIAIPAPASNNAPSVKLTWVNNSTDQTGFTIQVATDFAFTNVVKTCILTSGVATSSCIYGLLPDQQYYFRIVAKNLLGNSPFATTRATTSGQLPGTPTLLHADTITATSVALNWKNNTNIATGINIEIKVGAGAFTPLSTQLATATSFTATGLTTATPYQFRIKAFNADGSSPYSNIFSVTTP
ncbi:MAG: fibronectin type III domain-containing protein [bacterium]